MSSPGVVEVTVERPAGIPAVAEYPVAPPITTTGAEEAEPGNPLLTFLVVAAILGFTMLSAMAGTLWVWTLLRD